MTELIKQLLHEYGLLSITYDTLHKQREGKVTETYDDYVKGLGDLIDDEPVVVARISEDGQQRVLHPGEHDYVVTDYCGNTTKSASVMEMPEDEYYYFGAFRSGIHNLDKEVPEFMLGLGMVHAYSLFESYIAEVIRIRFQANQQLMGGNKKIDYSEVFESESKNDLIDKIIEKEVRALLYLPIDGVLNFLREKLGFRRLIISYDENTKMISLIRNCLIHNQGIVEGKLCTSFPEEFTDGEKIIVNKQLLDESILTLRKLAYTIDKQLEKIT